MAHAIAAEIRVMASIVGLLNLVICFINGIISCSGLFRAYKLFDLENFQLLLI